MRNRRLGEGRERLINLIIKRMANINNSNRTLSKKTRNFHKEIAKSFSCSRQLLIFVVVVVAAASAAHRHCRY